ncbi:MAG: hypothetical protein NTY48_01595 [Candidatus Diapherotrites archaeon]|nr:hypothetical protein [Candidatus Diapherotrites archaeon]
MIFEKRTNVWHTKADKSPATVQIGLPKERYFKEYQNKHGQKESKVHQKLLAEAKNNVAFIDNLHVGLIENFCPRKKFDVIFDYSGPLNGGYHTNQVFAVYEKALAKNGIIIINLSPIELKFATGANLDGFNVAASLHFTILTKK